MAERKILNLDAIVAETPERVIVWQRKEYLLAGVTGESYFKFLSLQAEVNKAAKDITEKDAMEANFKLIALIVPTFPMDELRQQTLTNIRRVTEFVIGEFTDMTAVENAAAGKAPEDGQETDASLGESTSP